MSHVHIIDLGAPPKANPDWALAPVNATGYVAKPRSHDPRTEARGTLTYPLTDQIADDIATHGPDWTRSYFLSRGVPSWELDIFMASAMHTLIAGAAA